MKKFMYLFLLCSLLICFTAGCADVAEGLVLSGESGESAPTESAHVMETAAPVEEGYYMVEGSLCEMGKNSIVLKTEDGQELSFKLAPETIIYAGGDKELSEGETIRVVFDGTMKDSEFEDISVIAVTVIEE
ncbi:MAG: hypothetical protein K2O16_14465 [Lachnospiraceae bacterium]|nr:hypothetical protein [Lachnospiraceae bacterium]